MNQLKKEGIFGLQVRKGAVTKTLNLGGGKKYGQKSLAFSKLGNKASRLIFERIAISTEEDKKKGGGGGSIRKTSIPCQK